MPSAWLSWYRRGQSSRGKMVLCCENFAVWLNRPPPARNRAPMDDDALIAAMAAGHDGALRELFSRHAPWLAARLRVVLPAADVEDVLQETFLAAWRGARRYRPQGAAGGWLWGIARRRTGGARPIRRRRRCLVSSWPRRSPRWGHQAARTGRSGGCCMWRTGRWRRSPS